MELGQRNIQIQTTKTYKPKQKSKIFNDQKTEERKIGTYRNSSEASKSNPSTERKAPTYSQNNTMKHI